MTNAVHTCLKFVFAVAVAATTVLAADDAFAGSRQKRIVEGAVVGGAVGAVVGGVAGGNVGSAVVGGAVGAVAGGAIADATHRRHCGPTHYDRYGRPYRNCR